MRNLEPALVLVVAIALALVVGWDGRRARRNANERSEDVGTLPGVRCMVHRPGPRGPPHRPVLPPLAGAAPRPSAPRLGSRDGCHHLATGACYEQG
jgi:hypothetical protein